MLPCPVLSLCRLAEQLQGLTSLTSTIRDGFAASPQARRQQAEAEKPEASYDCKQYTVGRVHSALTSTLHVHHDCFRFHFGHPRQGRIHVFLYFKDVDRATVSVRKQLFTFHVDRPLRTWFGTEYDPADPQHAVSMRLCKRAEVDEFAERMQQTLPGRVTVVP